MPALAVLLGVALLAVVAVVGILNRDGQGSGDRSSVASPTRSAVADIVPVSVTSVDPSGGSGFRPRGEGTWKTQTYRTAEFGNLKSGVGLLLDLGEAREVSEVALDSAYGQITVELRAADQPSGEPSGYERVGGETLASGATVLPGGGGSHRYWLVWVTRLAPQDGGFGALIDGIAVRGRAS